MTYTWFLTSWSVRLIDILSLASKLKRLIWKSCCILRRSLDGITTGLPTKCKHCKKKFGLFLVWFFLTFFSFSRYWAVIIWVEEVTWHISSESWHVVSDNLWNPVSSSSSIFITVLKFDDFVKCKFWQIKYDEAAYQGDWKQHKIKLPKATFPKISHFL